MYNTNVSRLVNEIQSFNSLLQDSSSEEVTDFALKVTEYLAVKLHYLKAIFYVYSEDEKLFKACSFYGCNLTEIEDFYIQNQSGVVGQAIHTKKPIYFESVNNGTSHIDFSSFTLKKISIYSYPIVFNNVCYGVIEMVFTKPLEKEIIHFLDSVSNNFGATLESILTQNRTQKLLKKTYQQKIEIEEAYKNISTISNIGQKITSILEITQLTEALNFELKSIVDFTAIAIATYREETNSFAFETGLIENQTHNLGKYIVGYDEVVIDKLFETLSEVYLEDITLFNDGLGNIPLFKKEIGGAYITMNSAVFFPLVIDNKVKGIFTIQSFNSYAFQDTQRVIVKMLAAYIAIAIENILAYRVIQSKNKAITDSIRYAQQMQQAILPTHDDFRTLFSDSFEIFAPKDIVSGDFYWFGNTKGYHFVVLVDCTGHGVPGALMSMIGDSALNQIILEKQVISPAAILTLLDQKIRIALRQDETDNTDGMEVLLCRFKKQTKNTFEIAFSGTKPKLYYISEGNLNYLIGDKKTIGGVRQSKHKVFKDQKISLKLGEIIYMTTDGIIDVCNKRRKKFGTKRLEAILKDFHIHPMATQKELILKDMRTFQEGVPQRDDVTILGIKL